MNRNFGQLSYLNHFQTLFPGVFWSSENTKCKPFERLLSLGPLLFPTFLPTHHLNYSFTSSTSTLFFSPTHSPPIFNFFNYSLTSLSFNSFVICFSPIHDFQEKASQLFFNFIFLDYHELLLHQSHSSIQSLHSNPFQLSFT